MAVVSKDRILGRGARASLAGFAAAALILPAAGLVPLGPATAQMAGGHGGASFSGVFGGAGGTTSVPAGSPGNNSPVAPISAGGGGGGSVFLTNGNGALGGGGGNGTTAQSAGGAGGSAGTVGNTAATDNTGTLTGGMGGGGGAGQVDTTISEEGGGGGGGGGGFGLWLTTGGSNSSSGSITGGAGGAGHGQSDAGAGGGGAGGGGLLTTGGSTYTNSGKLQGGTGGAAGFTGDGNVGAGGGGGGVGAALIGGGAVVNNSSGSITGGTGGAGGAILLPLFGSIAGHGGAGGAGVLINGGTVTNAGTITGGNGGLGGAFGSSRGIAGAGGEGIDGAGLTVINSGTITGGMSGDNVTQANAITFTGGSNVLELQSGYSISGNVVDQTGSGTFRLGGNANTSFDVSSIGSTVQYQGFASFVKIGSSTWTLTGSNTGALPWTINAGELSVTGTMANSTMTVNSGGTLAGTGTVGATDINNGAALMPGPLGGAGTLTINGNLSLAAAATYMVQVTAAAASGTLVNGTATLGGMVQANFASGSTISKKFTILTATGGLGGTTFSSLVNAGLSPGFTDSLSYDSNNVYLNLVATLGISGPLNPGQQNVANALNTYFNNGGALSANFGTVFGLSGPALANALSQLDGEDATDAQKGAFQLMSDFLNLMLDPIGGGGSSSNGVGAAGFAPEQDATLPPEIALAYNRMMTKAPPKPQSFDQRWSVWGSAFGGTSHTDGDPVAGTTNVRASDFGYAGGMDYRLSPDTVVGFALGGGGTNWNLDQNLGTGRSDAFEAGVYAKTHSGPAYLSAALAYANHWFTTQRTSALGDQLQAKFQGQSAGGRLEAGYRFGLPSANYLAGFTPYAAVQAQSFHTPTYTEADLTGGGFGLTFNAQNATDTRSELGFRADDLTMLGAMPLILRGRLAWAHDWISNPVLGAAFQTLPGTSFIVNGAAPPKNSALTTASAELRMTENWSMLAKFDGEFGKGAQTYGGTGTLRYSW